MVKTTSFKTVGELYEQWLEEPLWKNESTQSETTRKQHAKDCGYDFPALFWAYAAGYRDAYLRGKQ